MGGGCLIAGILATASLTGCGSSAEAPVILNTERVERAIEQSSLVQRKRKVHVSCPAGVHQRKGLVFDCVTVGGRASTRFVVTQTDGAGRVHFIAP